MKSPCKDCSDRQVGCHGSCAAYLAWAEGARETNRRESADRKMNSIVENLHRRSVQKSRAGQGVRDSFQGKRGGRR